MKIKTKFCKWIIKLQNVNPIKNKGCILKMKNMSKRYEKDKVRHDIDLRRLKTSNNTKYVLLTKKGNNVIDNVILYLHGGCYVAGLTYNYFSFVSDFLDLKDNTGVFLLDYSLAPEYKYPTQLNEALDLYQEIIRKYNINKNNIILGGDSSGGNLALALTQKLKETIDYPFNRIFLLSPWTDMTMSGESYKLKYNLDIELGDKKGIFDENTKNELLNSDLFGYLPKDINRNDKYVSPIFGDYTKFPKSLFFVGSDEILLDDTISVVNELKNNNQNTELIVEDGMFHSYVLFKGMMDESKKAYKKLLEFIKE